MSSSLTFKFVYSENDPVFHKAYILCCEIFPKMMPYNCFREYNVTVALVNGEFIGFMLLGTNKKKEKSEDESNSSEEIISSEESDSSENSSLASVSTNSDTDKKNFVPTVTIASIGIAKNMRRRGIADKYIKWVKDLFPDKKLELYVSVNNSNAINLYLNNGFTIDYTQEKYYRDEGYEPYTGQGIDAHIMEFINTKSNPGSINKNFMLS